MNVACRLIRRHGRRGFSLMEVVLATGILSVLLVAIGSAIVLASKALPSGQAQTDRVCRAARVAGQITDELRAAVHVTERSASAVAFTVADRNGDGIPERIRYAWAGKGGDPLTRQYNGAAAATVLEDVHQFSLAYELKEVVEGYPGPAVEGAEEVLSSYDGAVNLKEYKVEKDNWCGQYFRPSLPPQAVRWSVTRVLFRAKRDGSAVEQVLVQLRPAGANKTPTDTVLEERTLFEADLTDVMQWKEFSFSGVRDRLPGEGLCLVLRHPDGMGGVSARIQYEDAGGAGYLLTSDSGKSWTHDPARSLKYYVYGKAATPGPAQTAARQYVTAVRVTLQAGKDAASEIGTSIQTLNAPEALLAVWELDFNADPRQVDLAGDGGDWAEWEGTFKPETLAGGIWYAPNATSPNRVVLNTAPAQNFAKLTTVDLRYRATSIGGWGTTFWINADRDAAGPCAPLFAVLSRPDAASQTLRIGNWLPAGSMEWLATYTDLPGDLLHVRLVIDPAADTVAVFVNGAHKGTHAYTWGRIRDDAMAYVYTDGCSGEFDHVSVRVGGNGS